MLIPNQQKQLFSDLKQSLSNHYGERLDKIILFGSYARGDYHEHSDIDFLVVFKDEKLNEFNEILKMAELKTPLIINYGISISSIPMHQDRFENEDSPLLLNVRKEGVVI